MKRVLITGSRTWRDYSVVEAAILDQVASGQAVIIHGACPTGADRIAQQVCEEYGLHVEAHPADWDADGRAAGMLRNTKMVDLGADICLAFPEGRSPGTRDTMRKATAAGIPVINKGTTA
jgi:hypothetical protein